MGEVLTPRKQAVVDRLRRRIENYRRRQTDFMPRFDQTFNGLCEQNIQETLLLKQKFLENKAKRTAKKQDKKQSDIPNNIQNNLLAQQKFLKRSADDLDGPGAAEYGDSGPKIQCGGSGSGNGGGGGTSGTASRPTESLTKFSVEIVQQLEFTTSAANSQPQQISTNVTVKALTNASVKSDVGGTTNSPKSATDTSNNQNSLNQSQRTSSNCVDIGTLVECKQEPDSEFVDLEQCAAALEKDAQNNGASFPGFSEFIGDEGSDEIITSDAFKDLISEISDFHPEFMKDFDFDEHKPNISALSNSLNDNHSNSHNVVASITTTNQMKVESDSKEGIQIHQQHLIDVGRSPPSNVQYSSGQFEGNTLGKSRMAPYSSLEFGKAELSPAAQTLKQMAEQHQHKTQLGMGFTGSRNPRSPYADYQFNSNNDYINSPGSNTPPSSGQFMNKNIPPSSQTFNNQNQSTNTGNGQSLPEIKQEVLFSASQTQSFQAGNNIDIHKRIQVMQQQQISGQAQSPQSSKPSAANPTLISNYKQQYSPYSSPGGHGSPNYMPRGQGSGGPFVAGSAPSRPPSVPAGSTTLQMSQAQQLQVNQQTSGQQIQVSAGQHMQLTGDIKPNVSVAAQQQQGMFFNQQSDTYTVSQSQTINFTQQSLRGRGMGMGAMPRPEQQHKVMQQQQQQQQQHQPHPQQQQPHHQQQQPQQQQQLIRAQHQQIGLRPPPPEYKSSQPQLLHSLSPQRFPPAALRRPGSGQQPMPPSGPMMRPQHSAGGTVFMGAANMPRNLGPGGYLPRQRPPNVSVGPDGMPITNRSNAEWRHILMSQQQNLGFSHVRPFQTHQGNFPIVQNSPASMQMHSQIRGQLPSGPSGQIAVLPQDHLMLQGQATNSNQMPMNVQMSQSQSLSLSSGIANAPHHHLHHMTSSNNSHMHQFSSNASFANTNNSFVNSPGGQTSCSSQAFVSNSGSTNNSSNPNNTSSNNPSANDFGFEFLDSLPGDQPFSAQDLLSSLDSTSNFNINDIL